MAQKYYRSDLNNKQWQLIEPHQPPEKERGRPRTTDLREVVNALLYMLRTGCQWDMIPEGFPPKSTVNDYFNTWKRDGTLDEINRVFRENVRIKEGRNRLPSASIIDSQTTKTASVSESVGYDGAKKTKGRKRHIAVDVLGLLLAVIVHSAAIDERSGAKLLMQRVKQWFPGLG